MNLTITIAILEKIRLPEKCPNTESVLYTLEITPYLDTFHAVLEWWLEAFITTKFGHTLREAYTQLTITCLKPTLEKGVKYVQSQQ